MKRLTLNHVARANIRINKKAYISLFLGILLAVYLATATSLCAWGTIRGHEEQMAQRVGWMDMILLGNEEATDEQLRSSGFFREIGHVTVNAVVENTTISAGWYDETAEKLMSRSLKDGRLPERAGEMASERSTLIRMKMDKAEVGDKLELDMKPINGIAEKRTFILTGILNEQTDRLDTYNDEEGMRLPALLVSPEEKYTVGGSLVHRVLTYAPGITLNQVQRNCPVKLYSPYGVSREDGGVTYYDSGWERARRIANRILIWAVLGAALMLSACVGITSAMESLLSRKTEDIGMMRAIGATRRQIRRMYGAEAWLLAATALPAGMALGILTAWIVSRLAPDQVVFSLNAWLLIPVLGLSALCVFAASRLPLYHASRQMPMGVLRDTALLRKAGKVKNHQQFRPGSLIAGRRTRLHPLRQLGAAGMIALTLVSTLMLGELALGLHSGKEENDPDFQLMGRGIAYSEELFIQIMPADDMTRNDLHRIAAVEGVEKVRSVTEMNVSLLMDEVPEYFRSRRWNRLDPDGTIIDLPVGTMDGNFAGSDWMFFTGEDLADARARMEEDYIAYMNVQAAEQMELVRSQLGISETPVPVRVLVADLDAEELKEYVTDGVIDTEKLDSGEQVLVFAPNVCAKQHESGGSEINRWLKPQEIKDGDWDIIIRNDAFTAGMPLNLLEIPVDEDKLGLNGRIPENGYQAANAVRAGTTVGAVLSGQAMVNEYWLNGFTVILSDKGAEALGLTIPGPGVTDIYLSGDPAPEEEKEIENQIRQIAVASWTNLENRMELNREYQAKKTRQMMLFGALILLFFAVSVFMQVSGAARQIRSETRTIGTLRAVGADLKTLVGCYRLPVWVSAAVAMIPCLLFYAVTEIPDLRLFSVNHPAVMIPVLMLLAACVALACIAGIRGRLAGVARRSIVENIREL